MVTRVFRTARQSGMGRYAALIAAISADRTEMGLKPLPPLKGEPSREVVAGLRRKGLSVVERAMVAALFQRAGQTYFWEQLRRDYPALHDKCKRAALAG